MGMAKASDLGIPQKPALHLTHRPHQAFASERVEGSVEADETYVCAQQANGRCSERRLAGRGVAGKVAVGWILGPLANQFTATVLPDTNVRTLQDFVRLGACQGATPSVNDATTRQERPDFGREGFRRCSSECIWEQPHTDGPESFWSTMKRGDVATYVETNAKHLVRHARLTA